MPAVNQGPAVFIAPAIGETLTVTASATSSGLVRRVLNSGGNRSGAQITDIPAGGTRIFGPFPTERHYSIECAVGSLTYSITKDEFGRSVLLGNVEGFTGARTLIDQDNGKILRCDDASAVVVTVPNSLAEGFNVGFAMWGAGTVTVSAGSGATNRSSTSALSTQYGVGSLLVVKNASGTSSEFALGGSFA